MLTCLESLIGLSKRDCNCPAWTTGRPTNYNSSATGYFVDDNLNLVNQLYTDCGDGNIWDILQDSRNKALLRFEQDLLRGISKFSGQKKGSFSGEIGELTSNGINVNASGIVGWKIIGRGVKGSTFKIRSLKIGVNSTITTNVRILKNGVSVANINTTLTGNVFTNVALEYNCDLSNLYDVFHVVYDLPANVYPLNNNITCSCPGKVYEWKGLINQTTVMAQLDTDFASNANSLSGGGGMVINAYVGCDPIYFICDFDKLEGFNYKLAIAKAIQLLSEIEVINHILKQNALNFYTLVSRESLYGMRNHAEKEYEEQYISWLSQEFSKRQDCFECETTKYITKSAIMI
jgi:hypothetical protein